MLDSKRLSASCTWALAGGLLLPAGLAGATDRSWIGPIGGDFHTPSNWTPNGVPGPLDNAFIGPQFGTDLVLASSSFTVTDLELTDASELTISLTAAGVDVDETRILDSSILELSGTAGEFQTDVLDLGLSGKVNLVGGAELRVGSSFFGSALTDLTGEGTIKLLESADMTFSGEIEPTGQMIIADSIPSGLIDLENATIDARFGSLRLAGPTSTGPAGASIVVGGSETVEFAVYSTTFTGSATMSSGDSPTLLVRNVAAGSSIQVLTSGNGNTAYLGGAPSFPIAGMSLQGDASLNVSPGANAAFHGSLPNNGTVTVDGTLTFYQTNDLHGMIDGSGTIETADGGAVVLNVQNSVEVDMPNGVFELDCMWIDDGASASIHAGQIGLGDPGDAESGTVFVSGALEVTTPAGEWRLGDRLWLEPTTTGTPTVSGAEIIVTHTGKILQTADDGRITAPVRLDAGFPGAEIDIDNPGGTLELAGACLFLGGAVVGSGTLEQEGHLVVLGETSVDCMIYAWDGVGTPSTLVVGDNGVFTIASEVDPRDGSITNRGVLDVTNNSNGVEIPWIMQGTLFAKGGSTIRGGEMTLDNGGVIDLGPGTAPCAIIDGALFRLAPDGQIVTDSSAELVLDAPTVFDGGGGADIIGDGAIRQNGFLDVVSDTTVVCHRYDWDGVGNTTTIVRQGVGFELNIDDFEFFSDNMSGNIILESASRLRVFKNDPTWTMNGTMQVANNSQVIGTPLRNFGRIEGTTTFLTDVTNSGVVAPRPGNMTIVSGNYIQTPNGTLEITVGPTTLGRIGVFLSGSITIDGRLEVLIEDEWTPGIGTQYTIIQDDGPSLSGSFSEIDAPGFDVIYGSTTVKLEYVGLPCVGDVFEDGIVDVVDVLAVLASWGPCTCAADVNDDGVVDVSDLLAVLGAWGLCP